MCITEVFHNGLLREGALNWIRITCVVFFSLCGVVSMSFGQTLKVRLIDARNGRPLQNKKVVISYLYDKDQNSPGNLNDQLYLETNISGEAQFSLPMPAPSHLSVNVQLPSKEWRCGCTILKSTEVLILNGFVGPAPDHSSTSHTFPWTVTPRLILFTARPTTFFEKLMYPILKE